MTKRPITGKHKQLSSKANVFFFFFFFFLDIITLMLLAKFEFDAWFNFFKKKKTRKYQKIGFPLKPDDVIVMSSNVHEWKGKARFIV